MRTLFFLLGIGILFFTSCSSSLKEEDLTGTWKTIEYENAFDEIAPKAREQMLSLEYHFRRDHSVHITSSFMDEPIKGSWSLDEEEGVITINPLSEGRGKSSEFKVISFSDHELKLKDNQEEPVFTATLSKLD